MNIKGIIMEWFPAITTTALLSLIIWLSRNLIITRLTNSVRHEYDEKLESIKAELRKNEQEFKAELKIKETQIDALRSGALSGLSNRQNAIFVKQVEAIENVWDSFNSLGQAKLVSNQMAVIKFEFAAKAAATDPKVRELFSIIGKIDLEKIETKKAQMARPFISPLSWAYFSAYQAIVTHAVAKVQMLKLGLDQVDIIDNKNVLKLVKTALPHQILYIDKYGVEALHHLLDELEEKLLMSFQSMLKGEELSEEHIRMASEIIKQSESLVASDKLTKPEMEK
jgi:hypothetical protein